LLLSSSMFSSCGRGDEGHPSNAINAINAQSERIKSVIIITIKRFRLGAAR
jgi:hypothetical protein